MKKKLFLSTGAMKAGTTWLYSVLLRHPDLFFTPEKEIHFLNYHYKNKFVLRDDFRLGQAQRVLQPGRIMNIKKYGRVAKWYSDYLKDPNEGFDWYERLFKDNHRRKYNCDFSNLTCHLNTADWEDLNQRFNLKAIYVLRDPMKRLWSHIKFHQQFSGKSVDFEAWSERDFDKFLSSQFIKENVHYAEYINRMTSALGDENFKVFYFEDLISNPIENLRKLEEYLSIESFEYPLSKIRTKVNSSVIIDPTENFRLSAIRFLAKEYESLNKIGINRYTLVN